MPWEEADTMWALICAGAIAAIAIMALAVWLMREAHDAPWCECGDIHCRGECIDR